MVGASRIISEKLREHQCREGYTRSLKGKRVDWDGDDNVKHMWEQGKQVMVESAREVCCSVRVVGKNPNNVWWNNEVKADVRRKEAPWKKVLAASNEEAKERCMEAYREEKIKVKKCIYQSKKKVNEHFRRKINEDVNGNGKLFWREVSNAKGGKAESCSKIKEGNGRLAQGEDEV